MDIKHRLVIKLHSVQCQSLTGMNYQTAENVNSVVLHYIACTEEQRYVVFLMVINGVRTVQVSKMGKPNGLEKQFVSLQSWSA